VGLVIIVTSDTHPGSAGFQKNLKDRATNPYRVINALTGIFAFEVNMLYFFKVAVHRYSLADFGYYKYPYLLVGGTISPPTLT